MAGFLFSGCNPEGRLVLAIIYVCMYCIYVCTYVFMYVMGIAHLWVRLSLEIFKTMNAGGNIIF